MDPRDYIEVKARIRFRAGATKHAPAAMRHAHIRGGGRKSGWRIASIMQPATLPVAQARSHSTRGGGRRGGSNAHGGLPGAHAGNCEGGSWPISSSKQCRSTAQGTGRTRLVEANASRPGAVAADRFYFCRRHPMQADAGGATRVYVHGHVKWRTVSTRAARASTYALSFRRPFASTLRRPQTTPAAREFSGEPRTRRAIMTSRH